MVCGSCPMTTGPQANKNAGGVMKDRPGRGHLKATLGWKHEGDSGRSLHVAPGMPVLMLRASLLAAMLRRAESAQQTYHTVIALDVSTAPSPLTLRRPRRQAEGLWPVAFRNRRQKWAWSEKPHCKATSQSGTSLESTID